MKQVEFTETVKIGYETYEEGDRKSFDDEEAAQYIALGWAKDPETGETGERKPGANGPVVPAKVSQKV
jgi:hypothetical protein